MSEDSKYDALDPDQVSSVLDADLEVKKQQARQAKSEAMKSELQLRDFKASNDYNRHLFIDGVIIDTEEYRATLTRWARRDNGKPITITVNTPGGSVFDGNALVGTIQALRAQGVHFTIIGSGTLMSYGMQLLQAADHRVIERNCVCMIHGLTATGLDGGAAAIIDLGKMLEEVQNRLIKDLASRSNVSERQLKSWMGKKDKFLTAEQCLDYGFCDEVA